MSRPTEADIGALLEALESAEVAFIVVGGAAAVLHGAPTTTRDLDIVPSQEPDNLDRLHDLLADLDARVRDLAGRDLRPQRDVLAGRGQVQLTTRLGPLDVLCRLHDGSDYRALLPDTVTLEAEGLRVRLLDIPRLIAVKQQAGRARDRLVVPLLLALLERDG